MANQLSLISYPAVNRETFTDRMSHWLVVDDMTHVLCTADLQGVCIENDQLKADTVCCDGIDCAIVCAIVLHESTKMADGGYNAAARIIQWQSPALGIVQHPDCVCVTICGFNLYQQDCIDYGEFRSKVSKGNPCEIAEQLDCCLLEIALDKEGKAGFSHRDTTVTFRKPDIPFIKSMRDEYRNKCAAHNNCGRPVSRRGRIGIC